MSAVTAPSYVVTGFALGNVPGLEILALCFMADQVGLDGVLTGITMTDADSPIVYGHFCSRDIAEKILALKYMPGDLAPARGEFWTLTLDRGPKE